MKGILFKPEMVEAIVRGRKTQTRRIIKPQPDADGGMAACFSVYDHNITDLARYQVGEVVYIKEVVTVYDDGSDWIALFLDNYKQRVLPPEAFLSKNCVEGSFLYHARTMPAWAARYFIQITGVRPERLQEITEEDALAEGITIKAAIVQGNLVNEPTYRDSYAMLWDSINKKYPWESNPFVWRYEFKWMG